MTQVLRTENVVLNATLANKEEAIRKAGQVLVEGGYVEASYVEKMMEREAMASTYMGNFVAIPHGTDDAKANVLASGLSVIQVPGGVDFDGNEVKLLIGIAGKDGGHLEILSQIAIVLSEEENVLKMVAATTAEEILSIIGEIN